MGSALSDPTLQLRGSDNSLIATNDNWRDDAASAAELESRRSGSDVRFRIGDCGHPSSWGLYRDHGRQEQFDRHGLIEVYDLDATGEAG